EHAGESDDGRARGRAGPEHGGSGSGADQMWTTGQVRVRVMPSRFCTLETTSLPSSSTLRASARTITSYGPVTSSARVTPLTWAISRATSAALPTSVWMRMYAWTTMVCLLRVDVQGRGWCWTSAAHNLPRSTPASTGRPAGDDVRRSTDLVG